MYTCKNIIIYVRYFAGTVRSDIPYLIALNNTVFESGLPLYGNVLLFESSSIQGDLASIVGKYFGKLKSNFVTKCNFVSSWNQYQGHFCIVQAVFGVWEKKRDLWGNVNNVYITQNYSVTINSNTSKIESSYLLWQLIKVKCFRFYFIAILQGS